MIFTLFISLLPRNTRQKLKSCCLANFWISSSIVVKKQDNISPWRNIDWGSMFRHVTAQSSMRLGKKAQNSKKSKTD